MISKPSQKSRTFTSEIIAQFLQFTKSTSWSPNSWLKASGFQSSDLSFLCTPETSTGCGKKNIPHRKYFQLGAKEWNRRVSWGQLFLSMMIYCSFPVSESMDFNLSPTANENYSYSIILHSHPWECAMDITSVAWYLSLF